VIIISLDAVNMLDLEICVGDYVVISTEAGHYGLGTGVVRKITENSVLIQMEDELAVILFTSLLFS
jgi:small-conductance mechanosensitive channel